MIYSKGFLILNLEDKVNSKGQGVDMCELDAELDAELEELLSPLLKLLVAVATMILAGTSVISLC